jgi:hypothetical protein
MKRVLCSFAVMFVSIAVYAGPYEDCVLSGMKGVSSDAAARAVTQACQNNVHEARKTKHEIFGSPMREGEYEYAAGNASRHEDGHISEVFKNTSDFKTITYVALEVRDGDYYKFKKTASCPPSQRSKRGEQATPCEIDVVIGGHTDSEGELNWKSERTRTYFYKLSLKPRSQIKLKFREAKTGSYYSEIKMVLGRESKWSDAVSPSAWGNSEAAKPESKDPLE